MNESEIGGIVVDCAVKVPMRLGPGLLESVYEAVLPYEGRYLPYHKWETGMTSLFFSVSPCLRVRQFFRVELWVKIWVYPSSKCD